MQTWIWVLVVLVHADGVERDWNSFTRQSECIEVAQVVTNHREDQITARCERRAVK